MSPRLSRVLFHLTASFALITSCAAMHTTCGTTSMHVEMNLKRLVYIIYRIYHRRIPVQPIRIAEVGGKALNITLIFE